MENYVLKGRLLKQVSIEISPHLDGVVDGLVAEVLPDDSVKVYRLDRGEEIKAIPFLQWADGQVKQSASNKSLTIEYVLPAGRSKGIFMTESNQIMVPLQR